MLAKTKIHVINVREKDDSKERNELPVPINNFVIGNESVESHKLPKATKEEKHRYTFMSTVADSIGIAGIKIVFGTSIALLRRTLWLLVLVSGLGLVSFQIWDRISYFAGFPMNVNVRMKYVDELTFPAVAICNFNLHRRSAIAEANLSGLFDTLYTHKFPDFTSYNISTTASEQFYVETAHQLKSMMQRPMWQGLRMEVNVMKPILTDFGLCYAFNTGEDGDEIRKVKNTGESFGLSVILDAVQAEYNIGPLFSVGFQVMLYPQGEVPLVGDLGFAVSVGQKVRVGIDVTNITNLAPPHGSCGEKSLKYYDKYSRNACRMECATDFMVQMCGCKLFYMPGNVTVCDIQTAYYCGHEALVTVRNINATCECPVPCSQLIYKPNLSSAKFTSDIYGAYLENHFQVPSGHFDKNFAKLNIFFQELAVHEVHEEKAYSIFGLLCDIGGSLGLWLGGSILTVIEIFDICFKGCCSSAWR
ncbi:acid-sensing ion channel 2-like [Ptychodera flava]|uniref:acid-sensing ion channel 2-like n=1 Tax=Ptychodera flava TaxID=63121 RepID=UPI00396A0ACF